MEKRRAVTWAEKFHSWEGVGRKEVGEAIQRCVDWSVTVWITNGKDVEEVTYKTTQW